MSADAEPKSIGEIFRRRWAEIGIIPQSEKAAESPPQPSVADQIRGQRMETFRRMCPEQFQDKIDRAKIPNLTAWDLADAWQGTHPGIWLWSANTGEAKTRMLWRKFGQFHVERGRNIVRITGASLAEEYHDAFSKSRTGGFYADICRCDVVMLDDLDKVPLPRNGVGFSETDQGERNARMLRELFDRFYEVRKPVLVTANESISWFAERIGPSTERRMRETCGEIAF